MVKKRVLDVVFFFSRHALNSVLEITVFAQKWLRWGLQLATEWTIMWLGF